MNLSERLKMEREKKNFSQAYVAEHLHLTRQAISKWENGHTYPDIDNLKLLSKLYEVSLDNLLNSEQEKNDNEKTAEILDEKDRESEITEHILSREEKRMYLFFLSILVLVSCAIPPLAIIMGIIIIVINRKTGLSSIPLYILCFIVIGINIYNTYVILNNWFAFIAYNSIEKIE